MFQRFQDLVYSFEKLSKLKSINLFCERTLLFNIVPYYKNDFLNIISDKCKSCYRRIEIWNLKTYFKLFGIE